jgi:hypothetical protein
MPEGAAGEETEEEKNEIRLK